MFNLQNQTVRITFFITIFPLITLFLYGIISHFFYINTQQKLIEQNILKTKLTMMDKERLHLKEKVGSLTRLISHDHNQLQQLTKKTIEQVVLFSAKIANNLYHANKNNLETQSLKEVIKSALQGINFSQNIDYLFLLNLKGDVLIHRDKSLVNTNILHMKDISGKPIIGRFLTILNQKKQGFSQYYWYKDPTHKENVYRKTTYIKMLDAYDWYVGAGLPTDNISTKARQQILNYFKTDSSFKTTDFFISDSENNILFSRNQKSFKRLLKFRIEGYYKDDQYLAYTHYLAQHDWYITAVKELKSINSNITLKKEENTKNITEKVKTNLYLMLLSWLISLLLSLYLSQLIYRMIKNHDREIKNSTKKLIYQSKQATMGELLPMIAHQWRQPINKIASTLALMRFQLSEKNINLIHIDNQCHSIENNIEFMSETIDDFKSFYRPQERQNKEDLTKLITKTLTLLEEPIRLKGINIKTVLQDIQLTLYGNELMQVMLNLIQNAIEATSTKAGEIIIKLYQGDKNTVIISVEDHGIGISQEAIEEIFNPYFSTKKDSMGLGLYMSKMITEQHLKGTINVEKLNTGSRFSIILSTSLK